MACCEDVLAGTVKTMLNSRKSSLGYTCLPLSPFSSFAPFSSPVPFIFVPSSPFPDAVDDDDGAVPFWVSSVDFLFTRQGCPMNLMRRDKEGDGTEYEREEDKRKERDKEMGGRVEPGVINSEIKRLITQLRLWGKYRC